jgi:hypothetical protein
MLHGYLDISFVSVINKTANEVYIGCFGENNVPKASNVINFRGVIVRVDGPKEGRRSCSPDFPRR